MGWLYVRKRYALDILEEIGMLNAKPVDTWMDLSVKLVPNQVKLYFDLGDANG